MLILFWQLEQQFGDLNIPRTKFTLTFN